MFFATRWEFHSYPAEFWWHKNLIWKGHVHSDGVVGLECKCNAAWSWVDPTPSLYRTTVKSFLLGSTCDVRAGFWWRNRLEDVRVDGRILLELTFSNYDGDVDWFDMAQCMGQMSCPYQNGYEPSSFHGICWISWVVEGLLASQEGPCSM